MFFFRQGEYLYLILGLTNLLILDIVTVFYVFCNIGYRSKVINRTAQRKYVVIN